MIVYMKVTRDKYELPVAIADTVGELAKMTGASKETIFSNISHQKRGSIRKGSFKKVDIGELEEEGEADA